jgi:hypothetical protein
MKKLVALVVALVFCVTVTGCPDKKTATTDAKKEHKDQGKGTTGLSLTLSKDSVSIEQGKTAEVDVTINRTGFDEDVTITFKNLPKGVTGPADAKIAKGSTKGSYNLTAAADAEPVDNHAVTVEGKGGGKEADAALKVTVKKKS